MAQALVKEIPVVLTLSSTLGEITLLTPYAGAEYLEVRWISGTYGYLTTNNTTDGSAKGAAYKTYDAGQTYWLALGDRGKSGLIGLASDTNSGVVEVTAMPKGA